MFEHERKFVLNRLDAEHFLGIVGPRLALEVYDTGRPIAYTRTTYLDTEDQEYLRSCEEGPVARRLRIREYAAAPDLLAPPVLTGTCVLEMKESAGPVRAKARFEAAPEIIAHVVAMHGELPRGADDVLERMESLTTIRKRLRDGQPIARLTTWYRRVSLVGENRRIRVTMDEGITFCPPVAIGRAGERAEPEKVAGYGPGRVIEVKYRGDPPAWLIEAMDGLGENENFSKFREGMRAVRRATSRLDRPERTRPIAVPSGWWTRKT